MVICVLALPARHTLPSRPAPRSGVPGGMTAPDKPSPLSQWAPPGIRPGRPHGGQSPSRPATPRTGQIRVAEALATRTTLRREGASTSADLAPQAKTLPDPGGQAGSKQQPLLPGDRRPRWAWGRCPAAGWATALVLNKFSTLTCPAPPQPTSHSNPSLDCKTHYADPRPEEWVWVERRPRLLS